MPFDPNIPQEFSPLDAGEVRGNFNALKALIDAVPAGPAGPTGAAGAVGAAGLPGAAGANGTNGTNGAPGLSVPVGGVCAWMKDLPGTPALPAEFAECNGQVLADAASPYDGALLPDLNVAQRFLRGASTSGGFGGQENFPTRVADNANVGLPFNAVTPDDAPGAQALPPFYGVVWVMRVK